MFSLDIDPTDKVGLDADISCKLYVKKYAI